MQTSIPLPKSFFLARRVSENLFIFLLQYIGISLTVLHPTPMWMSTGTAVGFLFLRGLTITPGIFLGTLAAYALSPHSLAYACLAASLFTLQAVILLLFSYRFISPTIIFYNTKIFFKFLLLSAIITGLISFGLSNHHFIIYWLANFAGLSIAFAITTLDAYFPEINDLKKLNMNILVLSFVTFAILSIWFALKPSFFLFIIILIIGSVLGYVYRWCGAVTACSIFGFLLTFFMVLV